MAKGDWTRKEMKQRKKLIDQAKATYPDLGKRSLALYLNNKRPDMFPTIESARSCVRYYAGEVGDKLRKQRGFKPRLPETSSIPREPFIIPKNVKNLGIISDIHIPYHDVEALEVAINKMQEKEIDGLLINGDLIDFHRISRFIKDPRKRDLVQEIIDTQEFLNYLRTVFPDIPIYFKEGNHEERWEKFLMEKAPQFLELPSFQIEVNLNLEYFRIQYIRNKRRIIFGDLDILHGHEITGRYGAGVMPARSFYVKAKKNVLCSHVHRTQNYTDKRIDGSINGGWTTGCLSDLSPDYNPYNEYNLGFARVERIKGVHHNFRVFNYKIIEGQVI